MLIVSLHGIRIHAGHGLYPQEQILGNSFEVDVDIKMAASAGEQWPFVDYTEVRRLVAGVLSHTEQLLETLLRQIYEALRRLVPDALQIRVCLKKMHPPMAGAVQYAMVCFED
jgi:dihydroneopterin aldolase